MFLVLWQHWLQRPTRLFFTLLSLVLSTATLVGIIVASHNARNSFRELSSAVQGLPSLDVTNSEGGRLELSSLDVPIFEREVQAAMPMLVRGTKLRFKENGTPGLAIGVPIADANANLKSLLMRSFEMGEEEWLGEDECWMSALIASPLKIDEGDSVQCLFRRGFKKLVVKKIISGNDWNRISSEHGIVVDLKWLQQSTALPEQLDRYRLFLKNDTEAEKNRVQSALESHIPEPLILKSRVSTVGMADDLLKSTELGLSFASALAVAMAAYILLNTSRMNLAERRPYFAILRCLGATTQQVTRAVLIEAILISVVGVVFGMAAGLGLGMAMRGVLSAVLQAPPGAFSVPWVSLIAIALFIPCLTLFVVWFAQKQQASVSPLESFREAPIVENTRSTLEIHSQWILYVVDYL